MEDFRDTTIGNATYDMPNSTLEAILDAITTETTNDSHLAPAEILDPTFNCALVKLIMLGVVIPLVCIVGLVGNVLSLVTFWPRRNTNSMALLLMWLAVFDILVLLTYTLLSTPRGICTYFISHCPKYYNYVYVASSAFVWPFGSAVHLASTWQVTLATFHRYVAVCHPHQFSRWTGLSQTRIQTAGIAVGSLLYNLPRFVDDVIRVAPDGDGYVLVPTKLGQSKFYGYFYNVALYYLVIYAIPFVALTYMTICLVRDLRKTRKMHLTLTQAKQDEEDLTFTLVIVVLVYMVCQVLNPLRRGLALALPPSSRVCGSAYSFLSYFSSVGILVNSAANFFIYCLCGRSFRKTLQKTIRCLRENTVAPSST